MDRNAHKVPAKLCPGATIGIIAPGGQIVDRSALFQGISILQDFGLQTRYPRDLWPGDRFLADQDTHRLHEFNSMWNDSEVDAIICARGGYGCLRIAGQIVPEFVDVNKLFIGFSDICCLHQELNARCGLVTLHGPVVSSLGALSRKSLEYFRQQLFSDIGQYRFQYPFEVLRNCGKAVGISCGGNLSTIVSTLGTPLQPDWKDKIVFLEDTGEPLYRLDRMLTQLYLSNMFNNVSAIILGDFSNGLGLPTMDILRHNEYIWQRILDISSSSTTVIAGFPMGHGPENFCFPLGIPMILDCNRSTLNVS